jgi:2'-5' RNA ligase
MEHSKGVKTLKCTIAVFPSRGVQERANSYRKRYDTDYALIQPHIKLKSPFDIPEDQLPRLERDIQKVVSQIEPFDVKFHKIKTFYPNTKVIYFGIQETGHITTLHSLLNVDKLHTEEKYVFVPHLTIAQDMVEDEFHDVYGHLKMIDLNLESVIDRIHLLYQLEDRTWTVHQTFLLGKK